MNRNYNSKKNNSKITSPLLTALYCRLSLEDGKDNESMSISNQENICQGGFHPKDEIPYSRVEKRLTPQAPHRSVRAPFTHTAPHSNIHF